MKKLFVFLTISLAFLTAQGKGSYIKDVKLNGYIGSRINLCIQNQIMQRDVDALIEPFRHKILHYGWQSEFIGKWMCGACDAYSYTHDEELFQKIKKAAYALVATQDADGYIGVYAPEFQLADWDVWGQKYCLLGLQSFYRISHDKKALNACRMIVDHLMTQVGVGKKDIATLGNYRGLAASSILEPIMFLYKNTGFARYLDFAKYIVGQWEMPSGSMLISKALKGVPVSERFLPIPDANHWTQNGSKAYEMMSCYIGLLELYKVTKEPTYLSAVELSVKDIIEKEVNIVGGASATECFWKGGLRQTTPAFISMETCVTFTWMELCERLLSVTHDSRYADQIERSAYNALQGAMMADGNHIASYIPLEGYRRLGERQCGLNINCCEANGPRGYVLLPHFAYTCNDNCVDVNLYTDSEMQCMMGNKEITFSQKTDYPRSGSIEISLGMKGNSQFSIALRIPEWSMKNGVSVNGEAVNDPIVSGKYLVLTREWKSGDKIELNLDVRGRLILQNGFIAIVRGPVVFARDSRFNDGFVDETIAIEHDSEGFVPMEEVKDKSSFAWMEYSVNAVLSIYNGNQDEFQKIKFCDFGSAGNTWDRNSRYRVWLTNTIETADRHTWW